MDISANLLPDAYFRAENLCCALLILPLLMFAEGFINGGAMSLLVAYRPHWASSFRDHWYLEEK